MRRLAALILLSLGGCSGGDGSGAFALSNLVCEPGTSAACTCASGASGTKGCTNDGTEYRPCVCVAPDGGIEVSDPPDSGSDSAPPPPPSPCPDGCGPYQFCSDGSDNVHPYGTCWGCTPTISNGQSACATGTGAGRYYFCVDVPISMIPHTCRQQSTANLYCCP